MTTARPSAQIGATHAPQSQTQASSSTAQTQPAAPQMGQTSGAGQIQQSGQTPTRFTDWASI